ncbi:MAG TPA: pyrimidine dimer DNA glycosylase/endonuclease V [Victivallales bacterium]|nr:pyrimidine dimer DNA glycosylase/endonuclease V [Victivallales bacterium]
MRLWSIHPKYLDTRGLVALWRESLLAKKVLEGKTKGYKNHPQLYRFKQQTNPVETMNFYLSEIYKESQRRGFNFNPDKINKIPQKQFIKVTIGQVEYEFNHLLKKLSHRDIKKYDLLKEIKNIDLNPVFNIISGNIELWEKI